MLLSAALPTICPPRSRCGFRLIFADTRYGAARYTSKDLGAVVPNGDAALDNVGKKTLSEVAFVVGDWIDVAVYPEGHGGVGATGGGRSGGSGGSSGFGGGRGGVLGGPRENGFGGFRVRGGARGGVGVPQGEWRRGERVEDNVPVGGGSSGRDAGSTRGGSGGGGGYGRRGSGGGGRRYRD